jgi:TPR repeat protein
MAETHHELSSYIACAKPSKVERALIKLFKAEGMRIISDKPLRVPTGRAATELNYWRVAIIPGRPGWCLILTVPEALLCEYLPDGTFRFVSLCNALKAPGMLREANAGEGDRGCVMLEADGEGNSAVSGSMVRSADHEEDDEEEDGADRLWHGHLIPTDRSECRETLLAELLPAEWEQDPDVVLPDLREARKSVEYAQRLGGVRLSKFCDPEPYSWSILMEALALGEPLPVEDAVTLTFVWPKLNRPFPIPEARAELPLPDIFFYEDGQLMQLGDEVVQSNGNTGVIGNLIYARSDKGPQPRYVYLEQNGVGRMIAVDKFNRLKLAARAGQPVARPLFIDLEKRAEAGDANAQLQLGYMYSIGPEDLNPPKANGWLLKASKQGNGDAAYRLAKHYGEEFGVKFNAKKRLELAEVAYAGGNIESADLIIDGTWPIENQIAVMKKMADEGNEIAQRELGIKLSKGEGIAQDHAEAARLYEQAAAQGNGYAQMLIGQCYEQGAGVTQDYAKAAFWLSAAVKQDVVWAISPLARLYLEGLGVPQDSAHARQLLETGVARGAPGAREMLAGM